MPTCVSEQSYYLVFVTAVIIGILLIAGSAYSYDKFRKLRTGEENPSESYLSSASNVSIMFIIAGLLGVVSMFVLFFGFQKRLVGVYTNSTIPHTAQFMNSQ